MSSGPNAESLGDPSLLNDRSLQALTSAVDRDGRNLANVFPFVGGERGSARKIPNTRQPGEPSHLRAQLNYYHLEKVKARLFCFCWNVRMTKMIGLGVRLRESHFVH